MDRSFLTNAEVIEASRRFVCIRLATYEDEAEAEFLKTIYVNSSGDLENTVFCILSPDGDENLCRAGRGPHMAFRSARNMAQEMNKIADSYESKNHKVGDALLPEMKNIRLGVNVGACDGLPSVLCYAKDQKELDAMKLKMAPLALGDDLAGKFIFSSTTKKKDLEGVGIKFDGESGYLVVLPEDYGLEGKLSDSLPADIKAADLKSSLTKIASNANKSRKSHNQHVRKGRSENINWKTEVPVTDPMTLRAMGGGRR